MADFRPGSGVGHDVVVLPGANFNSFQEAMAHIVQAGPYAVLTLGANQLYLYNVATFQMTADNFLFI